ncbi:LacI family DNA-binding transcriptional regulator [Cohnella sp. 56]|uniref:LacI family DNA-binding transcriptional regulator n=1 Tax=Cohnella sp. 56 TaxID=3113722 RepID=UPI0030E7A781
MKKVTLQTIADRLGVSAALVSKALAGDPAVSDVTKEVIWKTAEEMGYRIKSSKKAGAAQEAGSVLVLLPSAYLEDLEYWGRVVQGIHNELTAVNCSMILTGVDVSLPAEEGLPQSARDQKVEGAILLGHMPASYVQLLKNRGTPLVLIDSHVNDLSVDHVLANNYAGAYEAGALLLRAGHRRLAFVGDPESALSFSERRRGFAQAAEDYNRARDEGEAAANVAYIGGIGVSGKGDYASESYAASVTACLRADEPVTAFFCANDIIAIDLLGVLGSLDVRCPADVSVCGFDDLPWGEHITPRLTTVKVPQLELGKKAVQLLRRRIDSPGAIAEMVLLPTQLIERQSVREYE